MKLFSFGDSITAGTLVASYINAVANRFNCLLSNFAQSGAQAADQAWKIEYTGPGDLNTIMVGTNDTNVYKSVATKRAAFIKHLRALAVVMGGANFVSGRNLTKTGGTWTNVGVSVLSMFTDTPGATCKTTVYGKAVYVSFIMFGTPDDPIFEVWIDGVNKGTVTSNGADVGPTQLGANFSDAAVRFGGLSEGPHEVIIKNIGPVRLHINYIAGSEVPFRKPVYIANVIKKASYLAGDSEANTTAYNNDIAALVSELANDGFSCHLVDINSVINPATDLIDALHPSAAGNTKIADKFIEVISASQFAGSSALPCIPVPCVPQSGHVLITGKNLDVTYVDGVPTAISIVNP